MTNVQLDSQLETYTIIKGILKTNSTLSSKFQNTQYFNFEPMPDSSGSNRYPYIVISVPSTFNNKGFIGNTSDSKRFEIEIDVHVEYLARDRVTGYLQAIASVLRQSNSTFESNGYYLEEVEVNSTPILTVNGGKQVIIGSILLVLEGEVRW